MDRRISAWLLTLPLSLLGGCVTTQSQNTITPASNPQPEQVAKAKKDDPGPKRMPPANVEVKFAKMKEDDADSEAAKRSPEEQAVMRDMARKAYQQALKINPNNMEACHGLARIYVKMGEFDRAQEIYKQAMAKNPRDASLWYDLGMCQSRRKDFPEAVRCFTKALELDPENREYMKKLGFTLAWTGQTEQGLTHLTRAQGSALAHYSIARVLLQKDQRAQAEQHLQIAVRENTQMAEARELLDSLQNPVTNVGQRGRLDSPVLSD